MKIVTAAIIRKNDKVLLTRRAFGERLQGFWEFPGGKLESGESLQECLERELLEELGVRSKAGDILCSCEFTYDLGSIKLIALETTLGSDRFLPRAHDKIEWVGPKYLMTYELAPPDVPIAEFIQRNCQVEAENKPW